MEEALYAITSLRKFAKLPLTQASTPKDKTIMSFRHRLEKHSMAASIWAVFNQYHFDMKAHIGTDAESSLVHSMVGTADNMADVTKVDRLLHGLENVVCADAVCISVEKRPEHVGHELIWQIAARRST